MPHVRPENPFQINAEHPHVVFDNALVRQQYGSDAMVHLGVAFVPSIGLEDMIEEHCPDFVLWLERTGRHFELVRAAGIGVTGLEHCGLSADDTLVVLSFPDAERAGREGFGSVDLAHFSLQKIDADSE